MPNKLIAGDFEWFEKRSKFKKDFKQKYNEDTRNFF